MDEQTRKIKTLLKQANSARRNNLFEEARQKILSALESARSFSDSELYAKSLNDMARIERDLGNNPSSIAKYKELLRLQEKNANKSGLAHALRHLGDIYLDEGMLDQAENHYLRALDIYRNSHQNVQVDLANAIRGYALLKEQQGKLKEALSLWKEARILYEGNNILSGVEECTTWIERQG